MYIIDSKRITTLKSRLGEAAELVDSDNFLPMFRNRQKSHPEEFKLSIKLAKAKKKPSRFFAAIWSKKNLTKTLSWIRSAIDKIKAKKEDSRLECKRQAEINKLKKDFNKEGRKKIDLLINQKLSSFRI